MYDFDEEIKILTEFIKTDRFRDCYRYGKVTIYDKQDDYKIIYEMRKNKFPPKIRHYLQAILLKVLEKEYPKVKFRVQYDHDSVFIYLDSGPFADVVKLDLIFLSY